MNEAVSLEESVERIHRAFHIVMKTIGSKLAEQTSPDVTNPQFVILKLLHMQGTLTVSEIADYMHVNPSAITTIVDRLVKRGLVTRDRDEVDRRVVKIALSEAGSQTYESCNEKRKSVMLHYLKQMDRESLNNFLAGIEQLVEVVQSEESSPFIGHS